MLPEPAVRRKKELALSNEEGVVWVDDLDVDVCWRLLAGRVLGRVGFVQYGEPVVLPVNHAVDGDSIVLRTAQTSMLEVLGRGARVAFEVDGSDPFAETGWSVLVRGVASEVTDSDERDRLATLPLHPWAPGPRERWIRIHPTSVTGRAISRHRTADHGGFLPYLPPD